MIGATANGTRVGLPGKLGLFLLAMLLSTAALAWEPIVGPPTGYAGGWYQDGAGLGGNSSPPYVTLGATTPGAGVTQSIVSLNGNSILRVSGVGSTTYAAAVTNGDYVSATFSANATWAPNGYRVMGYRHKPNNFSGSTQNADARLQVAIYDGNTRLGEIGGAQVTRGTSQYTLVSGTSPTLTAGTTYQIRFYVYSSGTVVELDNMELLLEARQVARVSKTWVAGKVGDIANLTVTGGNPSPLALASTVDSGSETDTSTVTDIALANSIGFSEAMAAGNIGIYDTVRSCTIQRWNAATGLSTTAVATLPYVVLAGDRTLQCTYTNTRRPTLTLVKQVVNDNGGAATADTFGITSTAGTVTWGTGVVSGTTTTYTSGVMTASAAGTYTLRENDVAAYTEGSWACAGTGYSGVVSTYNNGAVTLANGAEATCSIINNDSNVADLAVVKTRTPTGTLTVGQTINYTLVVTNNGPATATGAVITDTPQGGLSCPVGNTVNCSGPGCPAATTTVGTLNAGWTLGTLTSGQTATLTFSCTMQ